MRTIPLAFLLASLFATSARAGTPFPPLPAKTLDGKPLQLPAALPPCPVLLIVGFTRDSRQQTSAWSRGLDRFGTCATGVAVYQLVVTEDIPGLFRGMVVRGIRRSVPAALQPRFLLVEQDAQRWRELTGYADDDADDAYLLLLDADRNVRWRHGGALDAAAERALQVAIDAASGA